MPPPALEFARLQAPGGHGEILIEPAAGHWAEWVHHNRQLQAAYDFRVFNLPFRTVHAQARAAFGIGPEQPLILTGHQPGLTHAGVWIKQVLATRLASAVQGVACNLVVDQDAPKSPSIDLPFMDTTGLRLGAAACMATRPGIPYESLPPTDAHLLDALETAVEASAVRDLPRTLMPTFLSALRASAGGDDWVQQTMTACRTIDAALGADISDRRVSRTFEGALLGEILLEAPQFAEAYNRALADYRRRFRVRSRHHPMPDLARHGPRCETPLWIYQPDEPRRRLYVERQGDDCLLFADDVPVGRLRLSSDGDLDALNEQVAALAPRSIRPRALLLTLWARLLGADLFIHGIGGAKYDRVTDRVIREYFGVAPPAMVCASATLHLAFGVSDRVGKNLPALQRRVRDHWYNPQRYVDHPAVAALQAEKIAGIGELGRLRGDGRTARSRRRQLFDALRSANARIRALDPQAHQSALAALGEGLQRRLQDRVVRYREFFYGLHSRAALESLLDRLPRVQDLA